MKRDDKDGRRRIPAYLPGVAVSLFVFVLYLNTLAPTVLGFEPPVVFDSAMLQAGAYTLGIGHPTGYSTYMMLTHLFTYLPVGDAAYRVNLASAVFGALAVFVVYVVGLRLCGRVAAAVGAFAFGVSATFWSQAVIAEVYTLNVLFIAAIMLVLLLWRDSGKDRYLLLAVFLMGLSLTHHLTSALMVPAGVAFVLLAGKRKPAPRKFAPRAGVLFLLGLTPWLYLPVRALMEAPLNETDPSTPGRFLMLVTGGSFVFRDTGRGQAAPLGASGMDAMLVRTTGYWDQVSGQFPVALLVIGVVGVAYFLSRDRAAAALLGVPFVGSLLHGLVYGYEDYFLFLIPAYLVFSLFIAAGASAVLRAAAGLEGRRVRTAMLALLPVLMFASLFLHARATYPEQDRSDDFAGRRTIEAVAANAEPGATVLHHRSSLWYMALVEGRRRDLTLVDPFRTSFTRHNDIVWPDDTDASEAESRYGTGDPSGVEAARVASDRGAVYVLGREIDNGTVDVEDFREAGFRVVRVESEGELYRLVPSE